MGCFLACFGGAKDRKQRRRSKKPKPINRVTHNYQPLQVQASPSPRKPEAVAVVPVPELRENQEQGTSSSCRKKVTFDLNVRTYENVTVDDSLEDGRVKEVKEERETKVSSDPNYRYQNCESSDDEGLDDDEEEEEYDVSDFEDEEDEAPVVVAEEESYDSFFSLPIDKEKQQQQQNQSNCEEVDSPVPISISTKGSARDRSQYVHSVLNPVENLSQWKEVKVGALPLKTPVKENIIDKENNSSGLENKVTGFSPQPRKPKDSTKEEISVDASLSTWLVSSENSPKGAQGSNSQWSNSSVSREDQPILGALTIEDLKHSSVTSSPRRSPNRNPDEMPILGTVGSYWNSKAQYSESKGIPNTTSKYKEIDPVVKFSTLCRGSICNNRTTGDKKVNWHSTPFEVRLERALNKGSAEACPR